MNTLEIVLDIYYFISCVVTFSQLYIHCLLIYSSHTNIFFILSELNIIVIQVKHTFIILNLGLFPDI